jgi:Flp pilus assembly protein TadB
MTSNRNTIILACAALAVWIVFAVTHERLVYALALVMTGVLIGWLLRGWR